MSRPAAHDLIPPDLAGKAPPLRLVEEAVVVPAAAALPNRPVQVSGVLDREGALVPESLTWRGSALVSHPPAMPEGALPRLAGTHLWGGILFGHFGHFLVESTARLWAWERLRDVLDGILFVPKVQRNTERVLAVQSPLLRMVGIDAALRNVTEPVRVERLWVPGMGFGLHQLIEGTPEYRRLMREGIARTTRPEGGPRLYISRSALPPERGGLVGEEKIEAWLAAEGYEIFHPQLHDFAVQVARYRAARRIISPDGSPLHLVALASGPETAVAIIPRRPDGTAQMLARQLRAFAGIEAVILNHPLRNWIPESHSHPGRSSFGDIDIAELGARLRATGFIEGRGAWTNHDAAELAAFLAGIEARQRTRFRLHEEPPAPPG